MLQKICTITVTPRRSLKKLNFMMRRSLNDGVYHKLKNKQTLHNAFFSQIIVTKIVRTMF